MEAKKKPYAGDRPTTLLLNRGIYVGGDASPGGYTPVAQGVSPKP